MRVVEQMIDVTKISDLEGDGHSRKDVFLTFDVCTWEERAELRLVCLFL